MQKVKNEKKQVKNTKGDERPELKYIRVDKVFYGKKTLAECMKAAIRIHSAS